MNWTYKCTHYYRGYEIYVELCAVMGGGGAGGKHNTHTVYVSLYGNW